MANPVDYDALTDQINYWLNLGGLAPMTVEDVARYGSNAESLLSFAIQDYLKPVRIGARDTGVAGGIKQAAVTKAAAAGAAPYTPPKTPSKTDVVVPPKPTDKLSGYEYRYDPTYNTWYPVWVGYGAGTTPTPTQPTLTQEQASAMLTQLGPGYRMDYDETTGGWVVDPIPGYRGQQGEDPYGGKGYYDPYSGWQPGAGYVSAAQQAEQAYNQQYLAWQQQQSTAQLEAQKQERLATLQAQPASWLQYAIESKTPAVAQPWMMPLAPQQYGFQMGQPIPQFNPENLKGLPQLTTPSRQYQARMGPSAQQQYYGYEQARTGATPEDVQWRLWSQAPPSGQFGGLNWKR